MFGKHTQRICTRKLHETYLFPGKGHAMHKKLKILNWQVHLPKKSLVVPSSTLERIPASSVDSSSTQSYKLLMQNTQSQISLENLSSKFE